MERRVSSGDDRYALARRAERLDSRTHPFTVQAGPEIFGDPRAREARKPAAGGWCRRLPWGSMQASEPPA